MRRFGEYHPEDIAMLKAIAAGNVDADGTPIIVVAPPAPADSDVASLSSSDSDSSDHFGNEFRQFCKYFIPFASGVVAFILLVAVVSTSGAGSGGGSAKAVLLIYEGFRGDIFQQVVFETNKAPNLRALLGPEASFSRCVGVDDPGCARTQSGTALGAPFTFQAAPGIASILTGVNAQRHGVYNDSTAAISKFTASTAAGTPTIAAMLKGAGFKTAAVGSSRLMTTISVDGTCSNVGVIDFECGADMSEHCFRAATCNLDQRVLTPVSHEAMDGDEEMTLAEEMLHTLSTGSPDLLIVHTNRLARLAGAPSRPANTYSADSLEHVAEIYLLDAVVGQLVSVLERRSQVYRENWLVVGTSAHGGHGKSFGSVAEYDQVVPFFAAAVASVPVRFRPPVSPATQMDAVPTILRWFGLLDADGKGGGEDGGDDKAMQSDADADATPNDVLGIFSSARFGGRAQAVCSAGTTPRNCTV